jgi:hypothetical protein
MATRRRFTLLASAAAGMAAMNSMSTAASSTATVDLPEAVDLRMAVADIGGKV